MAGPADSRLAPTQTEDDLYYPDASSLLPVSHTRRSWHRVAFVFGLGGAALLAWHVYNRLKPPESRPKPDDQIPSHNKATANSVKPLDQACDASADGNNNVSPKIPATLPTIKVRIHQCPRGYLTPCISPFSLKLETFLRVAGIPYDVDFSASQEDGNVPWLTIGDEEIRESFECVSKICQTFNLNLESKAPPSRLIASRLVSIMLENHVYWGIALWRWVYDQGRTLPHIQPLSATSMATIEDIGSSVSRAAWYHGLGRLSPQQVTGLILKDLGDLSSALGKHEYFLGESPGEVDCGAFAMLSQMVWNMPGSPFEPGVKQYRNLVDFVLRMRDNFWPDWQALLQVRGEENYDDVGIFPGSEFLHKRQLNSDSSHWDSKGSSAVTLKNFSNDEKSRSNNRPSFPRQKSAEIQPQSLPVAEPNPVLQTSQQPENVKTPRGIQSGEISNEPPPDSVVVTAKTRTSKRSFAETSESGSSAGGALLESIPQGILRSRQVQPSSAHPVETGQNQLSYSGEGMVNPDAGLGQEQPQFARVSHSLSRQRVSEHGQLYPGGGSDGIVGARASNQGNFMQRMIVDQHHQSSQSQVSQNNPYPAMQMRNYSYPPSEYYQDLPKQPQQQPQGFQNQDGFYHPNGYGFPVNTYSPNLRGYFIPNEELRRMYSGENNFQNNYGVQPTPNQPYQSSGSAATDAQPIYQISSSQSSQQSSPNHY